MKKLMILGGTRYIIPVIQAAHDLDLYVITADYLPNNIAHKFSDEYCNVSVTDKDAVLKEAISKRVDGILSFACDPGVVTAAYVAEKMGLPSVGSYEAVSILQNKSKFRSFLARNGFNVPKAKGYKDIEEAMKDIDMFSWPVIVKPTDSAGSKGVKRVDCPDELRGAVENSLSYSPSKEFLIEDYVSQKGFSSDSDSFSIDGQLRFVSFNSQRFDSMSKNPYTPAAYSWPSLMPDNMQKELQSDIQKLINLLNLGTSIFNIETREGLDGKTYIMECSPRGGGNRLAECLEYATGVKLIENTVRAAINMDIVGMNQAPYDGYWAEIILHSNRDGIFEGLWLSKEIHENMVKKDIWVKQGSRVKSFESANWSIGTLLLRFNSGSVMRGIMDNVSEHVKVILR